MPTRFLEMMRVDLQVYALSENGATSTTASWLAQKENESDRIGGIKLNTKDHYLRKTLH